MLDDAIARGMDAHVAGRIAEGEVLAVDRDRARAKRLVRAGIELAHHLQRLTVDEPRASTREEQSRSAREPVDRARGLPALRPRRCAGEFGEQPAIGNREDAQGASSRCDGELLPVPREGESGLGIALRSRKLR